MPRTGITGVKAIAIPDAARRSQASGPESHHVNWLWLQLLLAVRSVEECTRGPENQRCKKGSHTDEPDRWKGNEPTVCKSGVIIDVFINDMEENQNGLVVTEPPEVYCCIDDNFSKDGPFSDR